MKLIRINATKSADVHQCEQCGVLIPAMTPLKRWDLWNDGNVTAWTCTVHAPEGLEWTL